MWSNTETHKRDWRGAKSFVKSANFAENCPIFATIGTFCSIIHESFSIFDPRFRRANVNATNKRLSRLDDFPIADSSALS
jgi:hypothetical protein